MLSILYVSVVTCMYLMSCRWPNWQRWKRSWQRPRKSSMVVGEVSQDCLRVHCSVDRCHNHTYRLLFFLCFSMFHPLLLDSSGSSTEDPLDAFMTAVQSEAVMDAVERRKLHVHVADLRKDAQRLRKLVELTRPAQMPSLLPRLDTGPTFGVSYC